jgi:hypothetical protein
MKLFRMRQIGLVVLGVLIVVAIAAVTTGSLVPQNQLITNTNQKLTLTRPPFMQSAQASMPQDIAAMLDQEAGISAWMLSPSPINLTNAANAFRVIELQTSDYIIGSVDLVNYTEHYDAHAYVHKDGWIMAYYLRQDPVAKMVSIKEQNIISTNLSSIIGTIASFGGVPLSTINYYDFRYTNAEYILLVYENYADGRYFTINMPTTFAYFERSVASKWKVYLNGSDIGVVRYDGYYGYKAITAAQMPAGVTHTILVDTNSESIAVLVIVYSEP